MKSTCTITFLFVLVQVCCVQPVWTLSETLNQQINKFVKDSAALNQLKNYAQSNPNYTAAYARTVSGIVFPTLTASLKVGSHGPLLLQDRFLIEKLQLFNRERIPERVAHAKGAGARGFFQVTNDISKYTQALFLQPKRRTNVAVRFSGASGELGAPDTFFDLRGFAVKFYTDDGNHDLTGINYPVFHTRDPIIFPDVNHARKRNPQTNLPDGNGIMDLASERTEMAFFLLHFFSDMSNPKTYRCLKGFGIHAYKMVNANGEAVYVKFHWTPHQKEEFFTWDEAVQMYSINADVLTQDLFDSIAEKNFPSWTLSIQVMTFEQAAKHKEFDPFDPTKLWRTGEYPLIPVGVMTLDKNPNNYFAEVEQIAFSPANMVRGIEPGPDAILQARMFAYQDAQLYRLGVNFAQIPINSCPFAKSYSRNGYMTVRDNGGAAPNYYPNSFHGLHSNDNSSYKQSVYFVSGDVDRADVQYVDDFAQPAYHWLHRIGPEEKQRIVGNVVATLKLVDPQIQRKFLYNIVYNINKQFGDGVKAALHL